MAVLSFMVARPAIRLVDLPLKPPALPGEGPAEGWGTLRSARRVFGLNSALAAAEAAGALRPPPLCQAPKAAIWASADWRLVLLAGAAGAS
jgi:hypothetical protein